MGDLLKGGISGLFAGASEIIGKFVTDPSEKLKADLELAKVQMDFQAHVMQVDLEYAKAQASVIESEVKSESWMVRNWRPVLMLVFTYIIAHTYIIVPMFGIKGVDLPPDMWQLLKIGMGGYVAGRSIEKVVSTASPALEKILSKK